MSSLLVSPRLFSSCLISIHLGFASFLFFSHLALSHLVSSPLFLYYLILTLCYLYLIVFLLLFNLSILLVSFPFVVLFRILYLLIFYLFSLFSFPLFFSVLVSSFAFSTSLLLSCLASFWYTVFLFVSYCVSSPFSRYCLVLTLLFVSSFILSSLMSLLCSYCFFFQLAFSLVQFFFVLSHLLSSRLVCLFSTRVSPLFLSSWLFSFLLFLHHIVSYFII